MNPAFNFCLSIFLFFQFDLPWWALVGFLIAIFLDLDAMARAGLLGERVRRSEEKPREEREQFDLQEETRRMIKLAEERKQYELRQEQRRKRREATGWESSTKKLFDARRKAAEQGPSNEDGEGS